MFRISYPNGTKFKKIMQASIKLIEEIPLSVTTEGLTLRALSPDKNALVNLFIPSTSFEEFNVEEETNIVVIKDEFNKAVRRAQRKDSVILSYERGARELKVILFNAKTGVEREFSVSISEAGMEPVGEIKVEPVVKFQIDGDDLKKIITDAKIVADEIEFIYENERILVRAASEDRSYRTTLELDRPLLNLESAAEGRVSGKYSLDLLKGITTALGSAETLILGFGQNQPLRIYMELEGGGILTVWIAPRV